MTGKKVLIVLGVLVLGAAVVAANLYYRRDTGLSVQAEALRTRDLEAIVSASGKVQPKRQVNVSANTTGRVTRVAVEEGQRVKAGQFLLEIDPKQLEGQLQRGEASVAAAQSALQSARTAVEQGRAYLDLARQNLKRQEDLWKEGLTTRENLERAQNDVSVREADLKARLQDIETNEARIRQEHPHTDEVEVDGRSVSEWSWSRTEVAVSGSKPRNVARAIVVSSVIWWDSPASS